MCHVLGALWLICEELLLRSSSSCNPVLALSKENSSSILQGMVFCWSWEKTQATFLACDSDFQGNMQAWLQSRTNCFVAWEGSVFTGLMRVPYLIFRFWDGLLWHFKGYYFISGSKVFHIIKTNSHIKISNRFDNWITKTENSIVHGHLFKMVFPTEGKYLMI